MSGPIGPKTNNTSTVAHVAALAMMPTTAAPGAFAFSPESLLYYCSSRLDSIDTQIGKYFTEQQSKNAASKQLGELRAILGRATMQKSGNEVDPQIHAAESNEILKIYREATDPEVKREAAEAFNLRSGYKVEDFGDKAEISPTQIKNAADKGWIVSQTEAQWTARIEKVKDAGASVSKSAELNMIQLQSLVSQRQLAIQLTTQLMQNVHESLKGIVANTRS